MRTSVRWTLAGFTAGVVLSTAVSWFGRASGDEELASFLQATLGLPTSFLFGAVERMVGMPLLPGLGLALSVVVNWTALGFFVGHARAQGWRVG